MTKTITFKVPADLTVAIRAGNAEATLALTDIAEDKRESFILQAITTGIAKTGNDSASGAKAYAEENDMTPDEARQVLIDKWVAGRIESGELGRVAKAGVDRVTMGAIRACRNAVKASDEQAYKNMDEPKRFAAMQAYFEGLDEAKREGLLAWSRKQVEMAEAQAAELAALELAVDI